MPFTNPFKKLSEAAVSIENRLSGLELHLNTAQERAAAQAAAAAEASDKAVDTLSENIRRHDMAIEDMLDEWADIRESLEGVLRDAAGEKSLLALCQAYEDQLAVLRGALASSPDWKHQFALIETELRAPRLSAGFTVIGAPGDPVDYQLHEVISVEEAADESRDSTICDVISNGYAYKGTVLRKARVSAFRFRTNI